MERGWIDGGGINAAVESTEPTTTEEKVSFAKRKSFIAAREFLLFFRSLLE